MYESPSASIRINKMNITNYGNLQAQIKGHVILPDDPEYNETRAVWNGMIDRYPAIIVRCSCVEDIVQSIQTAQAMDMIVSVRGGGHNVAGHATNDGGMVIDVSQMKDVHVDADKRIAIAQAGATWADVDKATQAFGLATPGGEVSETGIAGLTLGGGVGHLRRKHGLTIDNLLSVDMVTADGEVRHASATEHTDLFWAVRGAGGNFGIVVNFEYELHPVGPEVMEATVMYPFDKADEVIKAWRNFTHTAPDEVSSSCLLWSVPAIPDFPEDMHNQNVIIIDAIYVGSVADAEQILQPLRQFTEPLVDMSSVSPFVEVQSAFDAFFPSHIQRYYWKSLNLAELTDTAIDNIIKRFIERPSPMTLVILRHLGGAMGRVADDATAFGDRSANFNLSLDSTWANPDEDETNIAWTRQAWSALNQFSDGGVYLNFPGFQEEGEQLMRRQFGKNYERLVAIKKQYDPTNFFSLNQNIKPE